MLRVTTKLNDNVSKFTYSIHDVDIEPTDNTKYLGITINRKLSWNTHIDNITQKANRTLNFINRNFKTCTQQIKERLYNAYVRPSVEFGGCVWATHTQENIDKIERVQKRAARFVQSSYGRDQSVTAMMRNMEWTPLVERRARAKVTSVFKAKKDLVDIPFEDVPRQQSGLRSQSNFFVPFAKSNVYYHSYYPSAMRLWNALPLPIRQSSSLPEFERAIKGHTIITHY